MEAFGSYPHAWCIRPPLQPPPPGLPHRIVPLSVPAAPWLAFHSSSRPSICAAPLHLLPLGCAAPDLEEDTSPCAAAQYLCIGLLLQWSFLAFETRRSFIRGVLQQRLLGHRVRPPLLLLPPLVPVARSENISRRTASIVSILTFGTASVVGVANAQEYDLKRSLLQNLGIGDADIYYPRLFEGTWSCDSTLVDVDTPQGEEKADRKSVDFSRKQLGYTVKYKARFIPFNNNIIGDRLFTTMSLVESTVGRDVVDHGIWSPGQPDRLSLVLRGGVKVQNIVTKRSFSFPAPGQFDTSEYSQQIFDNATLEGGPPTIKASQNRTRYRWDTAAEDVSYVEAFQRVSMFPVIKEAFQDMDIMSLDKPVAVYKYLLRFSRELS